MPKEKRQRGRRAHKRKSTELGESILADESIASTPHEPVESYSFNSTRDIYVPPNDDTVFYGLLTEEEQEYFRGADELLELNHFDCDEDRSMFVKNLYSEVKGKELKLASSQGCSRLMEKLIMVSDASKLKALWQAWTGHFLNLVKHRFASHCCETLFLKAAPAVSNEPAADTFANVDGDEVYATMESMYEFTLNELEPQMKELLTDKFASHVVRTLLLVLSGRPITTSTTLVHSRKKENVSSNFIIAPLPEELQQDRVMTESLRSAVNRIIVSISRSFSAEELRSLAVHPIGSPSLQILIQIELSQSKKERKTKQNKKGETLLSKLTGIGAGKAETEDQTCTFNFFTSILYDRVGSHLAEAIVLHAPRKEYKKLYEKVFKGRMGSLARNETSSYVVQRVLEKLEKRELQEAAVEIGPQIKSLLERQRVSVLKTLIECHKKEGIELGEIGKEIAKAYDVPSSEIIFRMLKISRRDLAQADDVDRPQNKLKHDPTTLHGSLLAQSLLSIPGEMRTLITESLISQAPSDLVDLCKHTQASHVVQAALAFAETPVIRRILNILRGFFVNLAVDLKGSHIVDTCWHLRIAMNYRQQIAAEMLAQEGEIRESYSGRNVWRNWSMDLYKTKRRDWMWMAKEQEKRGKTALDLARERKLDRGPQGTDDAVTVRDKRNRARSMAAVHAGIHFEAGSSKKHNSVLGKRKEGQSEGNAMKDSTHKRKKYQIDA